MGHLGLVEAWFESLLRWVYFGFALNPTAWCLLLGHGPYS